jgi:DNA-directed RNA polymerase specialized sigma24 family protein
MAGGIELENVLKEVDTIAVSAECYTAEEYDTLQPHVASLLRDHVRDKKPYKVIAKYYHIPVGTVRSRIHRARAKLARSRAAPD